MASTTSAASTRMKIPMTSMLPPTVPLTIKKTATTSLSHDPAFDSHLSSEDLIKAIAHTPPSFSPGSLELPMTKRSRSGSISGRLRSASDLEERGVIDRYQKGVLKDLIISGNPELTEALDHFEKGDSRKLEALMDSGALNRKSSVDLLDDLDFGFLNVGELRSSPVHGGGVDAFGGRCMPDVAENLDDWDDMKFETTFADISSKSSFSGFNAMYGSGVEDAFNNSLPSMGMGITPPNPFGLSERFLGRTGSEDSSATDSDGGDDKENNKSGTRPIGIPGTDSLTPKKFVGAYSPDSRRKRIEKFIEKRQKRVWTKKVKYDVRKNFADSRLRVKGRFVKKEDEQLLRELLSMT